MMLSRRRSLPQELVDYTIDYLHNDGLSLRHCSLVSRGWTHTAQSYLFRRILIRDGSELERLTKLFEVRPNLALHVRTLRLKAYQHWMAPTSTELLSWIRAVPQILSQTLRRVSTIHFEHIQWDMFRVDNAFLADLSNFKGVQELSFLTCNFGAFETFAQIVLVFRGLLRLSLDVVGWRDDREALKSLLPSYAAPALQLRELRVGRFCHMQTVFDWLLGMPSGICLRALEIENVTNAVELRLVGRMLKALGPSLHHLKLGCKLDRQHRLQSSQFLIAPFNRYPEG